MQQLYEDARFFILKILFVISNLKVIESSSKHDVTYLFFLPCLKKKQIDPKLKRESFLSLNVFIENLLKVKFVKETLHFGQENVKTNKYFECQS